MIKTNVRVGYNLIANLFSRVPRQMKAVGLVQEKTHGEVHRAHGGIKAREDIRI
jgi:hypothetical protein